MKTLLEKVTDIEKEAQDKIRRAEELGQKELNDLLANEGQALSQVRTNAEQKASHIVQESINAIENETNALRQQGEVSIQSIHTVAKNNRDMALQKAWNLFQSEYLD